LNRLKRLRKNYEKNIKSFEFSKALREIYDFFWHDFCDVYIEKAKLQMKEEKLTISTQNILRHVLAESLKVLHPFLPFITEEIYGKIPPSKKNLLIVEKL